MNFNSENERLLRVVRMINKAENEVIEILNSNTSYIRSIERNSKSLKDPDPLSS